MRILARGGNAVDAGTQGGDLHSAPRLLHRRDIGKRIARTVREAGGLMTAADPARPFGKLETHAGTTWFPGFLVLKVNIGLGE